MMEPRAVRGCQPNPEDRARLKNPRRFFPTNPPDCVPTLLANALLSLPRSGLSLVPTGLDVRPIRRSRLHRIAAARGSALGHEAPPHDCRHRAPRPIRVD